MRISRRRMLAGTAQVALAFGTVSCVRAEPVQQQLRVGAAFPDPPFNGLAGNRGFDVSLMDAIGTILGRTVEFIPFTGHDFNDIFDKLDDGTYDCITSGTTITDARAQKASFVEPYLISGQALAVDVRRFPDVRSVNDLHGLTIGVQSGNTSQPIADDLVAQGKAKSVRVYDYGDVRTAIADLTTGKCDAFMKLAPVLTELVKSVPGVDIVQRGIDTEKIAIAVGRSNRDLLTQINAAQASLERDGRLPELRERWLGSRELNQNR
ncbi:MAG: ABC transporter substrate-binding protein [Nocardiaceae bacterium]|nr:ABC transporter substrate-binding protein [Nocardiaceae bacterium]